jgi:hypothetical protein
VRCTLECKGVLGERQGCLIRQAHEDEPEPAHEDVLARLHELSLIFRGNSWITILLSLDSKTSIIYTLGEQYEVVTAYSSMLFCLLSLVARFCKNLNACDSGF